MSEIDRIIESASRLPLRDAACELWLSRWRLSQLEETSPPKPRQAIDLNEPEVFRKVVRDALASVALERSNAHEGPTFYRMKRAHPDASDHELKSAIKAAVQLDQCCVRNFSYQGTNYLDDVTRAIDLAKIDNPGFLDKTYQRAWDNVAMIMR